MSIGIASHSAFYDFEQTRTVMRHLQPGCGMTPLATTAAAEVCALAPRAIVGTAPYQPASALAAARVGDCLKAGGALMAGNSLVTKALRVLGRVAGGAVGAATCLLGARLGFDRRRWCEFAANKGAQLGLALAMLPVGLSEVTRGGLSACVSVVVSGATHLGQAIAEFFEIAADFMSRSDIPAYGQETA